MQFTSFSQVVEYFDSHINLEKNTASKNAFSRKVYRLDKMQEIMAVLGNPQDGLKIIHVAGSKGKGSTSAFIANAIQALGYKTGLFMSPHVSDIRERFSLCGKFFDDKVLIETGNEIANKLDGFVFSKNPQSSKPTYFEILTAYSLLLFKNAGCKYAVLETGMGGRLDATNIVKPIASVLTPIELEHTEILGDTIEKIAIEKSKIIKKNVPAFVSYQKEDAYNVFKAESKATNSEFFALKDNILEIDCRAASEGEFVNLKYSDGYSTTLKLSMLGYVQAQNCALALLVLRQLGLYRQGTTEKALENTIIPGRMESLKWKVPLFIDGAHTPRSIENSINTFRSLYPNKTGVCIFGCGKGKDHKTMLDMLHLSFDRIIISKPGDFKKSDPEELFDYIKSITDKKASQPMLIQDAAQALEKACSITYGAEPILVCGSFYLAGLVRDYVCR